MDRGVVNMQSHSCTGVHVDRAIGKSFGSCWGFATDMEVSRVAGSLTDSTFSHTMSYIHVRYISASTSPRDVFEEIVANNPPPRRPGPSGGRPGKAFAGLRRDCAGPV